MRAWDPTNCPQRATLIADQSVGEAVGGPVTTDGWPTGLAESLGSDMLRLSEIDVEVVTRERVAALHLEGSRRGR
jgi:hypothetical protein